MDFGLWVEPEMVNPDSDLYRKHPDWVLNFPGRPRTEQRNQLVLNLARPDVRDYRARVSRQAADRERYRVSEVGLQPQLERAGMGSASAGRAENRCTWSSRATFTGSWPSCASRHPKVEIESCSGGGGRVDLGILQVCGRSVAVGQYRSLRPADACRTDSPTPTRRRS